MLSPFHCRRIVSKWTEDNRGIGQIRKVVRNPRLQAPPGCHRGTLLGWAQPGEEILSTVPISDAALPLGEAVQLFLVSSCRSG